MRWGSTAVKDLTSFLDIDQRGEREKGVCVRMKKGVTASEREGERNRTHCGFTGGQKISHNMSQV